MSTLSEQIIAAVKATDGTMDDYAQRSAIGMARSTLDMEPRIKPNSYDPYERRDALASQLVELMEESGDTEECVEALLAARRVVNAPYLQAGVHGTKELLKPGARRKAEKEK